MSFLIFIAVVQQCAALRMYTKTHSLNLPYSKRVLLHSGASHSQTMYVISSAVKHCNSKVTSLLPVKNTLQVIKQPYTPSSMVWYLLLLETVFVCLLIHCGETVQFMQLQNVILPSRKCTVCTVCICLLSA